MSMQAAIQLNNLTSTSEGEEVASGDGALVTRISR